MFVIVYVRLSNYFKLEIQLIKSDSCLILEVGANTREKFKVSFFLLPNFPQTLLVENFHCWNYIRLLGLKNHFINAYE